MNDPSPYNSQTTLEEGKLEEQFNLWLENQGYDPREFDRDRVEEWLFKFAESIYSWLPPNDWARYWRYTQSK